ncbi:hydrolase TatD [Lachnoclostridium sp. An169]|uniref:TatD family hydrolase n=1 Tax=Lachnoclostridium sp. An169 TaxID=1965569 RepID=UPI000B372666|nr:TatD family hydrolase [Lachnoclostridium sp. An169]OUP82728.1 hydrolase TatD [Lachnoclostridium sp. An169]HJA65407.1 TatD family hydrolase [Candidatus Mediterraneibacter cottocaccae]
MIFDTHAHYDDEQFDIDRAELLGQMEAGGIGTIVNAGSSVASWDKIIRLTEEYPFIYGAVGVHPDEVGELDEGKITRMAELLERDKIVAVGEIGLDYYWDKEKHDLQKKWFIRQIDLAREKHMPVIIHSREAAADTMEIMKDHAAGMNAVIHCYSYSPEMAREYVKMGYFIGIGGVVTFKNSKKLKEVVREIPLESIVLETDCPYLSPEPFRGKRNSSLNLPYVVQVIADLKETTCENVIQTTDENARRLYHLEKGTMTAGGEL